MAMKQTNTNLHAEVQPLGSRSPQQRLLAAQRAAKEQPVQDLPLRRARAGRRPSFEL